jgi:hypothetical protein
MGNGMPSCATVAGKHGLDALSVVVELQGILG